MTLRRVFVQSYSTKSAALRLIAGQQTIESTRVLSRIVNFLRIKNLPNDRALKTLVNAKEWTASTYTSGKHVTDMIFLRRAFKFSSVTKLSRRVFQTMIKSNLNQYSKRFYLTTTSLKVNKVLKIHMLVHYFSFSLQMRTIHFS